MSKKDNWVQLTDKNKMNSKCLIMYGGKQKTLDKFVTVGFEEDGDFCITSAELVEVGRALLLLREVYNRAMMQASPEVKAAVEAEIVLEASFGEEED